MQRSHARALAALTADLRRAVAECRLAYEFSPGSYTFGALNACLAAQESLGAVEFYLNRSNDDDR
jgi:hypothetical protein